MPIRVALHHKTVYRYDRLVSLSPQVIRLRPAPHCRTPIVSYAFKIEPSGHFINWQQDPQSNYLARVVFPEKVHEFSIEVGLVAEMAIINPFDFFLEDYAQQFPFEYADSQRKELAPYREAQTAGPRLDRYLASINLAPTRTIDFLVGLNQRLQGEIRYEIRMEPGVQTCEQTLTRAAGSCRDTAWLLVQICRRLGLAARFVSGYLIQLKPDVKPLDGPVGPVSDFTDLHAWAEVYLPGAGWVGLDATSGLLAGEGHIPLAAAPEPYSAAAVTGGVEACQVEFVNEMSVTRIHEDPRVTLPYTDAQWKRIEALGYHVDSEIRSHDIRLTMGGEPSFVSIDNMEGAEWSTEALGAEKRVLAESLIDRLRQRFAPGALLHFGQGKWYPGEPLPRWALACYWRKDGEHLWRDHNLLARHDQAAAEASAQEARVQPLEVQRFAETLARRLGLDPSYIIQAYEDPIYYWQIVGQLPVNVDTELNRIEVPQERERLRQVFERGLNEPIGVVLPLDRKESKTGLEWQTGLWMLRGEKLFAVPGDSPLGLRLPLSSLPWVAPADQPVEPPVDPWPSTDRCQRQPTARRMSPCYSWKPTSAVTASPSWANPRRGSFARRCVCSRAMAACTSSCLRSLQPKIISICSPPSKTRRPISRRRL